jgi:peroxidase
MSATPNWLQRRTVPWLKESRAGRPRTIKTLRLDQLESRTHPGNGILPLGNLPDWVQDDGMRAQATMSATPSESSGVGSAPASISTRSLPPESTSKRIAQPATTSTQGAESSSPSSSDASVQTNSRVDPSPTSVFLRRPPARWSPQRATSPRATATPGGPTGSSAPQGSQGTPTSRHHPSAGQATGYRPINEVGNNVADATLGTAGTDLLRVSPAAYADGVSAPSLAKNPSARVISDILNNQADPANPSQDLNTVDAKSLSDFGYAFGQFIDHDLDLTPTDPSQTLQILADPNDPSQMGNQTFDRSVYNPSTGTSPSNPRQQINAVTSYLDLSNVYGSTQEVADALRTFSGGLLKTSPGNMLPYDNLTYFTQNQINALNMANDAQAVPESSLFAAGDVRANENVELTALQTLFMRNHNLIAGELQQEHSNWTDEELYQEARKINIAEYQEIIYTQYLPDLLGRSAPSAYTGYNANVDPAIATEFSTVAFRFGHSLLSSEIERQGNDGQDVLPNDPAGANISLATDFFDPNVLNPAGVVDPLTGHISTNIGPILKGDADGVAQADDLMVTSDVRNLLFANGGLQDNGQDLIARDIERARDDGIGTYNQVREAYGLAPVTNFAQITSNVAVQQELQKAYGTVNNIDPFEGGMAEDHVAGSDLGPLFTTIIADQFNRLRAGDRFFYLNESWNADELHIMLQGNSLGKIIEANTGITNLQPDVFKFTASIGGRVVSDGSSHGSFADSPRGQSGVAVELEDTSGNVLATTVTDSSGNYSFNQLSGVGGTGNYLVRLVVPSGFTQTSKNASTILISRGDVSVSGVDFVLARMG